MEFRIEKIELVGSMNSPLGAAVLQTNGNQFEWQPPVGSYTWSAESLREIANGLQDLKDKYLGDKNVQ